MADKYLDKSGVELLWQKIKQLTDKKLESVEGADSSISVTNKKKISVNISKSENNFLKLNADGLQVGPLHKLSFGPYEYDGSKDVSVTIYDGEYNNT